MTLANWRKRQGLSLRDAAGHIREKGEGRISGAYVLLLEKGRKRPTLGMMDLISRGTDGAVTRMDWPEEKPTVSKKGRGG